MNVDPVRPVWHNEAMANSPLSFETRDDVMFYDTDCGGVVHNLAYLRMIETCRTKLGTVLGLDYVVMTKEGLFPVVVRHEIDYITPAVLGDTIVTAGHLGEVGAASFWCDFELHRASDNALLVKAHQRLALVKMPPGRPTRIPAELRRRWGL